MAVAALPGFTVPFNVALCASTLVAGSVVISGAAGVVKLNTAP